MRRASRVLATAPWQPRRVKRYGITLPASDLNLQCSVSGRSRRRCFVYANGGQCTGTLTEVYSTRAQTYRARNIDIGCGK